MLGIPSGDCGQHSMDVTGMLAPPIRLQYSHNYCLTLCMRETWQIKNRIAFSEKPIDNAVATVARPSYKANTLADLSYLKFPSVYSRLKGVTTLVIPNNHIPPIHAMLAIVTRRNTSRIVSAGETSPPPVWCEVQAPNGKETRMPIT